MSEERTKPEPWSEHRWDQLEQLERLLRDCQIIDNATGVLERLRRMIDIADRLARWEVNGDRKSFVHFLQEQARYGVHGQRRTVKK